LAHIIEALENLHRVRLDERGRIYVPKVIRERLQIKLGERIYIRIENDHFAAYTRNTIRKRLMQE